MAIGALSRAIALLATIFVLASWSTLLLVQAKAVSGSNVFAALNTFEISVLQDLSTEDKVKFGSVLEKHNVLSAIEDGSAGKKLALKAEDGLVFKISASPDPKTLQRLDTSDRTNTVPRLVCVLRNKNSTSSQSYPLTVSPKLYKPSEDRVELSAYIRFGSEQATRFLTARPEMYVLEVSGYLEQTSSTSSDKFVIEDSLSISPLAIVNLQLNPLPEYPTGDSDADVTAREFVYIPDQGHVFRPEPKKAKLTLSTIFVAALLGLWVPLLGAWFKFVDTPILGSLTRITGPSLVFMALLASYGGLLYQYWIKLSIFELLSYGTILSLTVLTSLCLTLANLPNPKSDSKSLL